MPSCFVNKYKSLETKLVNSFYELKWVEYSWSCIILHFSPHALHILILTHIYAYTGRSRGVEIENSSGASAKGVRWSTSTKCEDTNIAFGSRQAPVHITNILELYFSLCFNYNSWMCIRLWELDWCPSCIKVTFRSILVNPIARDRSLAMARHRYRSQ
jgi:hypothetical protein